MIVKAIKQRRFKRKTGKLSFTLSIYRDAAVIGLYSSRTFPGKRDFIEPMAFTFEDDAVLVLKEGQGTKRGPYWFVERIRAGSDARTISYLDEGCDVFQYKLKTQENTHE